MQNSREEHAECELIGLGSQIGAGRLSPSQGGFLCFCVFSFTANVYT